MRLVRLVLSYNPAEAEHGQIHRNEDDGDEQADEQDQNRLEHASERAEAVLELRGEGIPLAAEHVREAAGLLADAQQHDEPAVVNPAETLHRVGQAGTLLQFAGDLGERPPVRIKRDDFPEHVDALQQRDARRGE